MILCGAYLRHLWAAAAPWSIPLMLFLRVIPAFPAQEGGLLMDSTPDNPVIKIHPPQRFCSVRSQILFAVPIIICYCITNHPRTQGLKTTVLFCSQLWGSGIWEGPSWVNCLWPTTGGCRGLEDLLPRGPLHLTCLVLGLEQPVVYLGSAGTQLGYQPEHLPLAFPCDLGFSVREGWVCKGNNPRSSVPRA